MKELHFPLKIICHVRHFPSLSIQSVSSLSSTALSLWCRAPQNVLSNQNMAGESVSLLTEKTKVR